jgi:hypothetical protein
MLRQVTAMAVAADSPIDLERLAREEIADYLWFVPPPPEEHDQDRPQLAARHW